MRRLAFVVTVVAALASAPSARAQTDEDRTQALALLSQGIEFAETGDWQAARLAFADAYALVQSTRVLMNLAGAQRHTGQLLEAADSYRRWLADATDRDEPFRATVEQALTELTTEIPQVTVTVQGLAPTDVVQIDGSDVEADATFQIDPGDHLAEVRRGSRAVQSMPFTLEIGEQRQLALTVPSVSPTTAAASATTPSSSLITTREREDVLASPWLWAGVGAGAVLVIGIIIGVAVAASSSGPAPMPDMGTLGPFQL